MRMKLNNILKMHSTVPGTWEVIEMTANVITDIYVSPKFLTLNRKMRVILMGERYIHLLNYYLFIEGSSEPGIV